MSPKYVCCVVLFFFHKSFSTVTDVFDARVSKRASETTDVWEGARSLYRKCVVNGTLQHSILLQYILCRFSCFRREALVVNNCFNQSGAYSIHIYLLRQLFQKLKTFFSF